jgi:Leucine-rich repeat (LRR) protein
MGNLSTLQWLYLDHNQLSMLPAEIGNLTSLQTLDLKNNPLQTPPPEIRALGLSAILAYLRTLK